MQIFAKKTDKPVYRVEQIPEEDVERAKQYIVPRKFQFMV